MRHIPRSTRFLAPLIALVVLVGGLLGSKQASADLHPTVPVANARFGSKVAMTRIGDTHILAVSQQLPVRRVQVFTSAASMPESHEWISETALTPTDGTPGSFGECLALRAGADGTALLAVGSPYQNTVSIFRRSAAGIWSYAQELTSSEVGTPGALFGYAIAISKDLRVIAVGAPYRVNPGTTDLVGGVAIFRLESGTFAFSAHATRSVAMEPGNDANMGAALGFADLPAGQRAELLVGASGMGSIGKVLVLRENAPGTWSRVKTLAPVPGFGDFAFGSALAVSGNSAVVCQQASGFDLSGTAWALRRNNGSWTIEAELPKPAQVEFEAFYGSSASIEGSIAAVGARGGFTQLHRRLANGTWVPHELLGPATVETASSTPDAAWFGQSVALSGGVLAVGAKNQSYSGLANVGAVSLIDVSPSTIVSPDRCEEGAFGTSMALSGNRCAIGSPYAVTGFVGGSAVAEGSVRVLEFANGSWSEETVLRGQQVGEGFGVAVAMPDSETVIVSAPYYSTGGADKRGRLFMYRRFGPGNWQEFIWTPPPPPAALQEVLLGYSLAAIQVENEYLIAAGSIGLSNGPSGIGVGGVVLLRASASGFAASNLFAPTPTPAEYFGNSVAMERFPDGTIDLVAAASRRTVDGQANTGQLDLFRWTPGDAPYAFSHVRSITLPGSGTNDVVGNFPNALSMRGSLLVVGNPADVGSAASGSGYARVYRRAANGNWTLLGGVVRGLNAASGATGLGVATNGTMIGVARPLDREVALYRVVGSSIQYVRSARRITGPQNYFGFAIGMGAGANPALVVGAPSENVGDMDGAGAAFYFNGSFNP